MKTCNFDWSVDNPIESHDFFPSRVVYNVSCAKNVFDVIFDEGHKGLRIFFRYHQLNSIHRWYCTEHINQSLVKCLRLNVSDSHLTFHFLKQFIHQSLIMRLLQILNRKTWIKTQKLKYDFILLHVRSLTVHISFPIEIHF